LRWRLLYELLRGPRRESAPEFEKKSRANDAGRRERSRRLQDGDFGRKMVDIYGSNRGAGKFRFARRFPLQEPYYLMKDSGDSATRVTLLERIAHAGGHDQDAWREFVAYYGQKVNRWCLHWKLQAADAEDVTQIVLLKLAVRMKEFVYDPSQSFRAWLKKVAYHAWLDFLDGRRAANRGQGGSDVFALLESVEAREDLLQRMEEGFDRELLDRALEIVRGQFATHNWEAFCLTALQGVSAAATARQLNMSIGRVYAARSQIQQRLSEVCRKLEEAREGKES
jgi:RNA polymerase sigma-70 factor (ECF subfamily)